LPQLGGGAVGQFFSEALSADVPQLGIKKITCGCAAERSTGRNRS
jgi:hypothetical protein